MYRKTKIKKKKKKKKKNGKLHKKAPDDKYIYHIFYFMLLKHFIRITSQRLF